MSPTEAWTTSEALRRERRLLVGAFVLAIIAFGLLVAFVSGTTSGSAFDRAVAERLFTTTQGSDALRAIGQVLDIVGGTLVAVILVLASTGILLVKRHRHLAGYLLASSLGGVLVSSLTKSIVDRPRPSTVGALLAESTSSFPSGHATSGITTFVALAVVCLVTLRPAVRWWVAVPLALLGIVIGVSRVAIGVHWPTDVLGGWALGSAWTSAVALTVVLIVESSATGRGVSRPSAR